MSNLEIGQVVSFTYNGKYRHGTVKAKGEHSFTLENPNVVGRAAGQFKAFRFEKVSSLVAVDGETWNVAQAFGLI